jgi:hypothetical protein
VQIGRHNVAAQCFLARLVAVRWSQAGWSPRDLTFPKVVESGIKFGRTHVVDDRFPREGVGGVTSKTIARGSPKEGDMADGDWWFDLKTHTVVPDNNDTKITDRLGPYKTREEAERALELVEERNEAYDNDPRWNDDL